MGIVDYAATTSLICSGAALSVPFVRARFPQLDGPLSRYNDYDRFYAYFGIGGGGLGVILLPLLALFSLGIAGLFASIPILIAVLLETLGCVFAVACGVLLLRRGSTAPNAALNLPTLVGFVGVGYGAFLWLVFTIAKRF